MNEAFVRHLERASEIVSTWPQWKQNLLGRRTMNQVDQAARRAAERIAGELLPAKFKEEMSQIVSNIIAAEFAPVHERLIEAERLLGRAMEHWDQYTRIDIDKFLAAKENGNG